VQADAKRLKKAEAANGGFPLLGVWEFPQQAV